MYFVVELMQSWRRKKKVDRRAEIHRICQNINKHIPILHADQLILLKKFYFHQLLQTQVIIFLF